MPVDLKILPPSAVATMKTQLVHEREKLCQEAEFASHLIRAWGMLGEDAGETSAGHPKQDVIAPQDLVDRAVEVTEIAFDAFRRRGWIIDMVPADELLADEHSGVGFVERHEPSASRYDDDIPF